MKYLGLSLFGLLTLAVTLGAGQGEGLGEV